MTTAGDVKTQLTGYLKELHLPAVRRCFEEMARHAERETLSYERYQLELAEREIQERRENRITRLLEFCLSAFRDKESAESLFRRAIRHGAPPPRVINTDPAPTYPPAIAGLQRSGNLPRRCRHRPVQYLNNIVEQDHRFVKKRIVAKQGFSGVRIGAAHCRRLSGNPSNEERAGALATSAGHRAPQPLHRSALRPRSLKGLTSRHTLVLSADLQNPCNTT